MGKRVPQIVQDIRYIRDRARGVMGRLKIRSDSYREYGDATSIAKAVAADANLVGDILRCLAQLGEPACGRIAGLCHYGRMCGLRDLCRGMSCGSH